MSQSNSATGGNLPPALPPAERRADALSKRNDLYLLTVAELKSMKVGETKSDGKLDIERVGDDKYRSAYRYTSPVTKRRREPTATWSGPALKPMRAWRDRMLLLVEDGIDPLLARKQESDAQREALKTSQQETKRKAETLRKRARAYHASIVGDFRNAKHRKQWLASIEGSLPESLLDNTSFGDIGEAELLDVLLPLRDRVPETAKRVRQRLEAVWDDAMLRKLCTSNPAAAIARRMRQKRRGETPHVRALHYRDVPGFLVRLRASDRAGLSVKLALQFIVETATRSGEGRGAVWNEIDRKEGIWTIPAERMKGHETHRVHLTPRALEILDEAATLRTDTSDAALVFPPPRNSSRPLSDMAFTQALRRLETGQERPDGVREAYADLATMHGFRTAFSTWANSERVASPDVIEAALAHKETDRIRAAYNRSAKEGERFERELRTLRHAWSDYIGNAKRGKVVSLRRAASV
jgi:integrase